MFEFTIPALPLPKAGEVTITRTETRRPRLTSLGSFTNEHQITNETFTRNEHTSTTRLSDTSLAHINPPKNKKTILPASPTSILNICDDNLREDIFAMLPPADICHSMASVKQWRRPSMDRLNRPEIHVPGDMTTIHGALQEVATMVANDTPYDVPNVILGPGEHLLTGGILLIDHNVSISGTVERDPVTKNITKSLTSIVGRIRIEGGDQVRLEQLNVINRQGAGIYCTGKDTKTYLNRIKVSGCRGSGIYVRDGAYCEMANCNISNNDSTGISAWDKETNLKVKDTSILSNMGDGATASTGANVSIVGASRIRSNSTGSLRADDEATIVVAESSVCEGSQTGNVKSEEEAAQELLAEEADAGTDEEEEEEEVEALVEEEEDTDQIEQDETELQHFI
jgi:parallel beta-helix repeat protein